MLVEIRTKKTLTVRLRSEDHILREAGRHWQLTRGVESDNSSFLLLSVLEAQDPGEALSGDSWTNVSRI